MGIKVVEMGSVIDFGEMVINKVVQSLLYAGEVGLNTARNEDTYKDRTGNLRSSVGYAVLNNRYEIVEDGFLPTSGSENGSKGQLKGKEYLDSLKVKYGKGITLIMVAGMEYSGYVEANYSVLANAEIKTIEEFSALVYKLKL